MRRLSSIALVALAVLFSSCGQVTPTTEQSTQAPVEVIPGAMSDVEAEMSTPTGAEGEPALDMAAFEPQRMTFESSDGAPLVGLFWPPAESPAPGILLMHWMPGDKNDWLEFGTLLQGVVVRSLSVVAQERRSYAVFAFDFRGHGESGGDGGDRPGYVNDARAALAFLRTMPGVDPDRIVLIGASVGADAAVDACAEGCIGAVSLSPGGYLGIAYADALRALGDKPVLCVAAVEDTSALLACREGESLGLSDYQIQIYQGAAHGMDIFAITEEEPALQDLIFEWLVAHVP